MKKLTEEWITKAENDFLVAKREYHSEAPIYDAVCFHAQQCVEKHMKAILQENNVYFEKTHDLDVLLEKCKTYIPALTNSKQELIELSTFAVEIRYPGATATNDEADRFLNTAENIRNKIRKYFGLDEDLCQVKT